MKVTDANNPIGAQSSAATAEAAPTSADKPLAQAAGVVEDRVSTDDRDQLNATVANAVSLAAGERASRLRSLAQQVRSGTYTPNISRLAQEILAQAELDARLAQSIH